MFSQVKSKTFNNCWNKIVKDVLLFISESSLDINFIALRLTFLWKQRYEISSVRVKSLVVYYRIATGMKVETDIIAVKASESDSDTFINVGQAL